VVVVFVALCYYVYINISKRELRCTLFFVFMGVYMSEQKPIKQIIKENHLPYWKIAEVMGIHENTLIRRLRHEPDGTMRQEILEAINKLKQ